MVWFKAAKIVMTATESTTTAAATTVSWPFAVMAYDVPT